MSFGWDPAKSRRNVALRQIPFAVVDRLDWSTALVVPSVGRTAYAEDRYLALGVVDGVLHAVVLTPRAPMLWIISVRRASRKERRRYAQATEP